MKLARYVTHTEERGMLGRIFGKVIFSQLTSSKDGLQNNLELKIIGDDPPSEFKVLLPNTPNIPHTFQVGCLVEFNYTKKSKKEITPKAYQIFKKDNGKKSVLHRWIEEGYSFVD